MPIVIPTIDDFSDTTVLRQFRKMAKYIKTKIVPVINELEEKVDTLVDNTERIDELEIKIDTVISNEATARQNADVTGVDMSYSNGTIGVELIRTDGNMTASVIGQFIKYATLVTSETARAFKIAFTFTDDSTYETNDFVIPEGSGNGSDVTVSAVTVIDGSADNSFKVRVMLSDNTPIDSNDYVIDIPSVSGFVTESDLNTAIANLVSQTDLNTAIANFITESEVNTKLNDYVTTSTFDSRITTIESNITTIQSSISSLESKQIIYYGTTTPSTDIGENGDIYILY